MAAGGCHWRTAIKDTGKERLKRYTGDIASPRAFI
jgi:hypothetical protein